MQPAVLRNYPVPIAELYDISSQVRGFYNSGVTTGHACAQVAFKCLTSPTGYPINDGSFRNLTSIVPMGKVVSAVRPAPMRWWMTFPMTVVDTVFKALEPAIPHRVISGHHADLIILMFHGVNPRTNEFCIGNFGPLGGGYGPAIERPAEQVAEDVKQGYVSIAAAAQSYGVVLDPESLEPDLSATEQRRKEMA